MAGNHAGLGNFNMYPPSRNAHNFTNPSTTTNHITHQNNNPPNQEFCDSQALQWIQYQQAIALALMSSNFNYNLTNLLSNNSHPDQTSAKVSPEQSTIIKTPLPTQIASPFNTPLTLHNDPNFSQFNFESTIDLSLQKSNRAHADAASDQHQNCQQQDGRNAHLLSKQTKGTSSLNSSRTSNNNNANNNQKNNVSANPPSSSYWRLLESLYAMNDKPGDDAIELIAQRISATKADVVEWFQGRRDAERSILYNSLSSSNVPNATTDSLISLAASSYKPQPPAVPSSALLAKLAAVTSRPSSQVGCDQTSKLDHKMIDLLEAFYAINDNPEPAAIEMIAKRINTSPETIGNWFDERRIKMNPQAEPRSPPAKKREGGRVVTFSEYQRSLLEAIFDETNYLHPQEYEELSNLIQVPSRNIKIWFKNRRSKQRLSGRITSP